MLVTRNEPEAEDVKAMLRVHLARVQALLQSGGTTPTAFTLHDAGHAFRVAQRMVEVIPDGVVAALTCFELALLLLAAYLHDVGMVPEERMVEAVHQYLLIGDPVLRTASGACRYELPTQEIDALTEWLDNDQRALAPPLARPTVKPELSTLARELTASYCRSRHNEWSAGVVAREFAGARLSNYSHWLDDLILLCKSHHFGIDALRGTGFDAKHVGEPPRVVHLRYLACVLRVADILDFDPERTPDVVFQQRDIPDSSVLFWHRDHEASVTISPSQIHLSAQPKRAPIHKALLCFCDSIESELRLCRQLADEKPFSILPGAGQCLPHEWSLPASLEITIVPRTESYEYIEGSFRPNTARLLELLSGQNLYAEPLAAVREVLQNAFDAVREQVAYERLQHLDPTEPSVVSRIESLHTVTLALNLQSDPAEIECSDDGVGMTRAIIRDYFLVAGNVRRHDVLALERLCRRAGFRLSRTGAFGVGVLSYFLLADHVTVVTRRSQLPGDDDATGWRFETSGVGDFGELRKVTKNRCGTAVTLRLRSALAGSKTEFADRLISYLKSVVRRVPCRFVLRVGEMSELEVGPGWIERPSERLSRLWGHPRESSSPDGSRSDIPVAAQERADEEEQRESRARGVRAALDCLKWEVSEGRLQGDLGAFRLSVPHFELPGGACLGYLAVHRSRYGTRIQRVGKGLVLTANPPVVTSWKGMRCNARYVSGLPKRSLTGSYEDSPPSEEHAFLLEVDLDSPSAGKLDVARELLELSSEGGEAIRLAEAGGAGATADFAMRASDSLFATVNAAVAGVSFEIDTPRWCQTARGKGTVDKWAALRFPATLERLASHWDKMIDCSFRGRLVTRLTSLNPGSADRRANSLILNAYIAPFDVVAELVGRPWDRGLLPLWLKNPFVKRHDLGQWGLLADFPPPWSLVIGARFNEHRAQFTCWNRAAPVVAAVDRESWCWAIESPDAEFFSMATDANALLADPRKAAAWFLASLRRLTHSSWVGLTEAHPRFWSQLVDYLTSELGQPFPALFLGEFEDTLIAKRLWKKSSKVNLRVELLPEAPDDWKASAAYFTGRERGERALTGIKRAPVQRIKSTQRA